MQYYFFFVRNYSDFEIPRDEEHKQAGEVPPECSGVPGSKKTEIPGDIIGSVCTSKKITIAHEPRIQKLRYQVTLEMRKKKH